MELFPYVKKFISKEIYLFYRIALSAVNLELTDYDSRTALHVASAEGKKIFFWGFQSQNCLVHNNK